MAQNPEHLEHPANSANPVAHESSDVNIRAILGFGAALVVVAAVVHLLIYVLFGYFNVRENAKVPAEYPLAATAGHREPPSRGCRPIPARTSRIFEPRKTTCSGLMDGWTRTPASSGFQSMRP